MLDICLKRVYNYIMEYLNVSLTKDELLRIFSKISINDVGCWIWNGAKIKGRGYGVFNFRGKSQSTHRLLFAHFIQPIPIGRGKDIPVLDHIVCDNPSCCNPKHLKLTLQKYNVFRGSSGSAINHRKTHCINGHKLPEPSELYRGNLTRRCVICRRANAKRRRDKKKQQLTNN